MAIHSSGLFDHRAVLSRSPDGVWRGRAEPNQQLETLVGDAPAVELNGGMLTLTRRGPGLLNPARWRAACSRVSVRVGAAFEAVLEDDDRMAICRFGTGDLTVHLLRRDQLLIATGASDNVLAQSGISVECDPRALEDRLRGIARTLERPNTRLIWIDPAGGGVETTIESLRNMPPDVRSVVIVVRSDDPEKRIELNHRLMSDGGYPSHYSRWFEAVAEHFRDKDAWLDYLGQLPSTRPSDLFLRFGIDDERFEVHEGEYRCHRSWHFYVRRVFREGIPGQLSQYGVARTDLPLTAEQLISSVEHVGSGVIFEPRS